MKRARNLPNALREAGRGPGNGAGDLRKQLLRRRRNCPGYYRQQLAGSHSDERQEVFGSFVFRFRLGRQFSQVLHHRVGIDLSSRTHLVFEFVLEFAFILEFAFVLAFAEQAAQATEDSAELILSLIFEFILGFPPCRKFVLVFQLVFEFAFQFIFQLVRHGDSSCGNWSDNARPLLG